MINNILFLAFLVLVAWQISIFLGRQTLSKKRKEKSVRNINTWMRMSRDDRNSYDENLKRLTMERKKKLIDDIRKEYDDLNRVEKK